MLMKGPGKCHYTAFIKMRLAMIKSQLKTALVQCDRNIDQVCRWIFRIMCKSYWQLQGG